MSRADHSETDPLDNATFGIEMRVIPYHQLGDHFFAVESAFGGFGGM